MRLIRTILQNSDILNRYALEMNLYTVCSLIYEVGRCTPAVNRQPNQAMSPRIAAGNAGLNYHIAALIFHSGQKIDKSNCTRDEVLNQ